MSNKAVLLDKHHRSVPHGEPGAALDYLQLRNREALRQWRTKRALASAGRLTGNRRGFAHWVRQRRDALLELGKDIMLIQRTPWPGR
jgi:hypothetical protein